MSHLAVAEDAHATGPYADVPWSAARLYKGLDPSRDCCQRANPRTKTAPASER
jgi:hypothetical protein